MKKYLLLLMALLLMAPAIAQEAGPEILWDDWGVPHIFASSEEDTFYAFGWAQAHNHADLILQLYGEARGRAAKYWGTEYLENDLRMHLLRIPEQGEAAFAALSAELQTYVEAFAGGINDYASTYPERIDDRVEIVLPVTAADILMHSVRVLRYEFVARGGLGAADCCSLAQMGGSNAWAIAPARSANGHAMLVTNPHQPWYGFGMWVEAHLVSPLGSRYGAALVGQPVLGVAFNDQIGWTMTVNAQEGWDLYRLELSDDDEGYVFDGTVRLFETRTMTLLALEEDGSLSEHEVVLRESVHGPIVSYQPAIGRALALRVVGEDIAGAVIQWWEMSLARDLESFEAALRPLRIPMFTVTYADRAGNILQLFNAQVPVRNGGDWDFWSGQTRLGGSPSFIPGDDPTLIWDSYHSYDELPRVLNPESGWLQNANEPPWTTTYPLELDPANYPTYMTPPSYVWPRPRQSIRLMMEMPERITFEELVELKQTTYAEYAIMVLDDLIAVTEAEGSPLGKRAADVLAEWDRDTLPDSVGAVLFTLWAVTYFEQNGADIFAVEWDINDPLNTPRGLKDPSGALAVLEQVAVQLELLRLQGGGIDVPYGDVFRLRYLESGIDLPANGGNDIIGSFRTLTAIPDDDMRFVPVAGDSYQAIIEFSDPVRAHVLLSHGNATQPGSPHVGDQLVLFAEKQMREALLTREAIEANLELREILERP